MLEAKNSLRDTAKLCEVSLSTVQKVQRELKGEPRVLPTASKNSQVYDEQLENYEPFIKD